MPEAHGYLHALLKNIEVLREKAVMTQAQLEERLILGPGWISRFEKGETVPSIDMVLAILHETNTNISDLLEGLPEPDAAMIERCIFAEEVGNDVTVYFRYAKSDARYTLPSSTLEHFEKVIKTLRDGLARRAGFSQKEEGGERGKAVKTDAVARTFLAAVHVWPHVNPSDLWWFIVYRAYCDPYNHPANFARLNFEQSWKRTGGWALEVILTKHYGPFLKKHGIMLLIPDTPMREKIVQRLNLEDRVEADKIDVVLWGNNSTGAPVFFGVVHVKASFAERRTDDVPLSRALTRAGYTSPLWTMDCKSMPGPHPINRGELGATAGRISAKRKDIEAEGYFTGCFSYNQNTVPSAPTLPEHRRVYVCDFNNPDDAFSRFIISRWQTFPKS